MVEKYSWAEFKDLSLYKSPGIGENLIAANYNEAHKLALSSFNSKYFKQAGEGRENTAKELKEMKGLVELFKTNIIQKGIDGMGEEYSRIGDKGYRGMDKLLVQAMNEDSFEEAQKILARVAEKSRQLSQTLQYDLPEWLAKEILKLDSNTEEADRIDAALTDIRGASAASDTSLKRLGMIYGEIEKLATDLDSQKRLFNEGRIFITNAEKNASEEAIKAMKKEGDLFEKQYAQRKTSRGKTTFGLGSSLGGYYTSVFGTVYEMMVKEAIKRGLGEAATVAVVGGNVSEGGRSKTDVALTVNGKDLMVKINPGGADSGSIEFNEIINAEFSVKSNKMNEKTTLLQTTLDSYINLVGSDNYTHLLEHYFKMAASVHKPTEKDATVNLINRYIASKNISKIIGDGIDFITFGNKTVTKYEYIASYVKKAADKQVRAVDKSGRKIVEGDYSTYYPPGAIKLLLNNR